MRFLLRWNLRCLFQLPVAFSRRKHATRQQRREIRAAFFARERGKVEVYLPLFGGNSQVGRKYVIRNLVSCIGKSSYYSTRIPVRILRSSFFPRVPSLRAPPNVKFYFASRGNLRPVARRYFYSNFSRSVLSKFLARPAVLSKGAGIALCQVEVTPLVRSNAPQLRKFYLLLVLTPREAVGRL